MRIVINQSLHKYFLFIIVAAVVLVCGISSSAEVLYLDSKLDFGNVRPESGQVGLNGGSSRGAPALTIVSFDNWAICETADECTPDEVLAVQATGKLPTIWGALKARY